MPLNEYVKKRVIAEKKRNSTYLNISDCGIGLFKDDVDELVELLKQNQFITSVNLYRNVIDNEGAKKLALLTHIKEFNLSFNDIDDDGIIELLSNPHIKRLNLSRCGLTNKCVDLIIKCSRQKDISLTDNNIDKELMWKAYNHIKSKNSQLSELQLKRMLLSPETNPNLKKAKVSPPENGNEHDNKVANVLRSGNKSN